MLYTEVSDKDGNPAEADELLERGSKVIEGGNFNEAIDRLNHALKIR
jgi:hypothetical protein